MSPISKIYMDLVPPNCVNSGYQTQANGMLRRQTMCNTAKGARPCVCVLIGLRPFLHYSGSDCVPSSACVQANRLSGTR